MRGRKVSMVLTAFASVSLFWASLVSAGDYAHQVQAKKISFAWTVNGDKLAVKLSAPTKGWVAVGFNPTDAMKGANIIFGYVKDGKPVLTDHFGDGLNEHKADTKLGGTEDATLVGGSEEGDTTTIEFTMPLGSADANDNKIDVNADTVVLLAYGLDRDSIKVKHKFRTALKVNLSTGSSTEAKR